LKSVEKAIWYIESHFCQPITLDDLVQVAGISRYHLSRLFSYTMGMPITRYLRDRRLSQAADELANGKSDILDLALSFTTWTTRIISSTCAPLRCRISMDCQPR